MVNKRVQGERRRQTTRRDRSGVSSYGNGAWW